MSTKKGKVKPAGLKIEVSLEDIDIPSLGNRGLKPYIFYRFLEVFNKTKDLSKLPTQEEMLEEVKEKFPTSRFLARPKVHYSYYKSKFFSFLREEKERQLLMK